MSVPSATATRGGDSGRIVLIGCSGCVGEATAQALCKEVGCDRVTICTRDTSGSCAAKCGATCRCRVVHADYNDQESMRSAFSGASAVFLIEPGAENRAELMQNGLNACKAASVPFILTLALPTAISSRTVFGSQFSQIETATKACGIPYAFLRVPLFTDNLKMCFDEIRSSGKLPGCLNPSVNFTTVTTHDIGVAAAKILANPSSHRNASYTLMGPSWNKNDAVAAASSVLGRRVEYEHKSFEEWERLLQSKGMPAWQARGTLELLRMCDEGRYEFKDTDFKKLTGHDPMSVQRWLEHNRDELISGKKSSSPSHAGRDIAREKMGAVGGLSGSERHEGRVGDVSGPSRPIEGSRGVGGVSGRSERS